MLNFSPKFHCWTSIILLSRISTYYLFNTYLNYVDIIGSATSTLRQKGHDRIINCAVHIQIQQKQFMVTGSEDTTMKIWSLEKMNYIKQIIVLRSHISSVKTIDICENGTKELIMVSAGGRAQLKVWKLNLGSTEEQLNVSEIASHMLKGNDKLRQKTWRSQELIDDTETR